MTTNDETRERLNDGPIAFHKAHAQVRWEGLIDAQGELEWTCPRCLERNDMTGGDVWEGISQEWAREQHVEIACEHCGHDQEFELIWEPTFTPIFIGPNGDER